AGGLLGSAQALDRVRESNTAIEARASGYVAEADLQNTAAFARSDLVGFPDTPGRCVVGWDGIPAEEMGSVGSGGLLDRLIALMDAGAADPYELNVRIGKAEALDGTVASSEHLVGLNHAEEGRGMLGVGRNEGGAYGLGFPRVVYSDGDGIDGNEAMTIDDPTATRIFRLEPADVGGPGVVRTLLRWDENGDGRLRPKEPIADLRCPFQAGAEVTVTWAPSG
ncbi:MAG: hypothetical protein R3266_11805, partial [Gemmatimonadota bacterium]|nr:hypothetical protein [Gemmatimonadota bacterium]